MNDSVTKLFDPVKIVDAAVETSSISVENFYAYMPMHSHLRADTRAVASGKC